MNNKNKVKKQIDKVFKENDCIFVTSEGVTIVYGDYGKVISSIAFGMVQLEEQYPEIYSKIQEEIKSVRKYRKGEK